MIANLPRSDINFLGFMVYVQKLEHLILNIISVFGVVVVNLLLCRSLHAVHVTTNVRPLYNPPSMKDFANIFILIVYLYLPPIFKSFIVIRFNKCMRSQPRAGRNTMTQHTKSWSKYTTNDK